MDMYWLYRCRSGMPDQVEKSDVQDDDKRVTFLHDCNAGSERQE